MAKDLEQTGLAVGSKAPAFKLPRDDGGSVSLADFAGRKLVLYFYPKADTPGCTREAIDFSKLRAQFDNAGVDILGVSADSVAAQSKFKSKHGLGIDLLSDETHKMRSIRCLGEKIDVRQELHGNYPGHLPDRPRSSDRAHLAEGQGRGPCRRGARRGEGDVTPPTGIHSQFPEN